MWVSGGEDRDAQVYVYTIINVKARSKRQHGPVCLQYPKSRHSAFPAGVKQTMLSLQWDAGCGETSPPVSPASWGV